MKKFLLFILICTLAACEKMPLSTVDPKVFPFGQNKDTEIKHGDDFFMYCNGNYWKNSVLNDENSIGFFFGEGKEIRHEHYKISDYHGKLTEKLYNIRNKWGNDKNPDYSSFKSNLLNKIQKLKGVTDLNSFASVSAELIDEGYFTPLSFALSTRENTLKYVFCFPSKGANFDFKPNLVTHFLTDLGFSNEEIESLVSKASSILESIVEVSNSMDDPNATKESEVPISSNFALSLIEAMGLNKDYFCSLPVTNKYFQIFEEASIEDIKALTICMLACDYIFISEEWLEKVYVGLLDIIPEDAYMAIASDYCKSVEKIIDCMSSYVTSYEWTNAYFPDSIIPEIRQKCEETRSSFENRIRELDWMSETTKQKAIDKLNAVVFNIAKPNEWIEEAIPTMSGNILADIILELRRFNYKGLKQIVGKKATDASMNQFYLMGLINADTDNAFYEFESNSVVLLPAMCMKPIYDPDRSDAINYAFLFTIVGHELTHGFDSEGAKYDKNGRYYNWWIASDKMEFDDRCKKLERVYSNIEVLPEQLPGLFHNGSMTITEDIADNGGVNIAYDAYMAHLNREGYYGIEKENQERIFYEAFAELWRSKYNAEYVNEGISKKDPHSLPKIRVNATLMNIDRWYELYNVKWGDALYIPKERRATIW